MKHALMQVLVCPCCRVDLNLRGESTDSDEIVAGTLECSVCAASFDIRDGVPCMLQNAQEMNRTRQGFTEQWQLRLAGELEDERSYGQDPFRRAALLSEIDIAPMMKSNGWILDAGCGPGDITYAVAAQNPQAQVVGLDFSDTIYAAAKRARNHSNINFVHGDVMQPPFKASTFAGLYSWGVLHHTEDTKTAFQVVAPLVAKGGYMNVWLYPRLFESPLIVRILYLLRDFFFFGRGHLIPGRLRLYSARVVSLLWSPAFVIAFGLDGLLMRKRLGPQRMDEIMESFQVAGLRAIDFYRYLVFLVFDSITPERQSRHGQAEVLRWFKENGFFEPRTHDAIPGYYWGRRVLD